MAKLTVDEILSFLEQATILEVSELVKAIETKFGVSAAAPVAVAAVGGAAPAAAAAEAPTEVKVILKAAGDKKLDVIKVIRQITNLGLKEAKDLVDGAPSDVKVGIPPEEAKKIKEQLEAVGAQIEIK